MSQYGGGGGHGGGRGYHGGRGRGDSGGRGRGASGGRGRGDSGGRGRGASGGRGRGESSGRGGGSDGGGRGRGGVQGGFSAGGSSSGGSGYQAPALPTRYTPPPPGSLASVSSLSDEMKRKLNMQPLPVVARPSSKALVPPRRPGYGTKGRKCTVRANHFLVQVRDMNYFHYDVSINPEVTSKKVNREIIGELVKLYGASHLGGRMPVYDGRKNIYTAGPLPFQSKEFVVKLADRDAGGSSSSSRERKERSFKVAIKLANKGDLNHLQQFLRGRQLDCPQETLQVLDVVLRATPSNNYVPVGRHFFSKDLGKVEELGNGLQYWRGYYQSLRPTQIGLSLNIDVSARSFYEPILVSQFVRKYFERDPTRPLSDQDRVKLKKALRGIKVESTHLGYQRSYKITTLSNQPLREITFTQDDGREVSIVQYFQRKYNIVLKNVFLPAIQTGSEKRPVYLPMEVCKIADGQRYTKRLNEKQVAALLRATCQRPEDRERSIRAIVRTDNYGARSVIGEFGIGVSNELASVDARVLPAPQLRYHDSGREASVDPWMGQWNMINKKMINGGRVDAWTCVNFSRLQSNTVFNFCAQLVEMCSSKGMVFNPNPIVPMRPGDARHVERVLEDVCKDSLAELGRVRHPQKQLQLLLIILPDMSGSYGKIKRICETELGIVSQCCQPKQVAKLSKQYFENVALKINVKVGGRNTVLHDAISRRIPHVSDVPTIIFGADVTHPAPGEDASSIAAVVASMDWPEVTKYRALVSAQSRAEMIEDLYKESQSQQGGLVRGGMIREMLIAYRRFTGLKPHRIIFYRDGVSEGEFSQVLLYEMDQIRKACASLEDGYLPPVTFIVVQKRHHTRLFPDYSGNMKDKSGNVLPGTVIDTHICHPTEFDFYLNSHAGIKGTSRPTHYHVLYDENNFSADELQMLTNNLCFTYARCTRSVSVVPPAYYAHLAAFRARYYIEGDKSDGESSGSRSTGTEVKALPSIKDNVKDVMFYC